MFANKISRILKYYYALVQLFKFISYEKLKII